MKKIDYHFSDDKASMTYTYPSPMCDFDEVHKGIIYKGGMCVDMCISKEKAQQEIKQLKRGPKI